MHNLRVVSRKQADFESAALLAALRAATKLVLQSAAAMSLEVLFPVACVQEAMNHIWAGGFCTELY